MRLLELSSAIFFACVVLVACGGDDKSDDEPAKCSTDFDCINAGNPCQIGACGDDGVCAYEAAPDGAATQDVEGDCRHATCTNGLPEYTPDNSDIGDDDDPCTVDSCANGEARHVAAANGTSCRIGSGSGTCQTGSCFILCNDNNVSVQCDDDDPCTTDTCGECTGTQCLGQGRCTHGPADGEGPDDFDDCTVDLCQAGEPVHDPAPAGTTCSSGGNVCNGSGQCVDCMIDDDCEGTSVPTCFVPACDNGSCSSAPAPAGTTPPDTDSIGDCHAPVCSGTGSSTNTVDDTDVYDDGNACTIDICTDGVSSYTFAAAGTSCGASGETCSDNGLCCTEYVYSGSATDLVALRYAYASQYSYTTFLSTFSASTGATTDLAVLDFEPLQVALAASGRVYFADSSGFGVLAYCGGTELEAVYLPEPDTTTSLSVPAALAYDSSADQALLLSSGGSGVLYGYAPSTPAWTEIASMNDIDAVAATVGPSDMLYVGASAEWYTTLRPYTTAGVAQATVALSPTLSSTSVSSVQLRAAGSYLYYILQGYDLGSYYEFVQVNPSSGATATINP